MRGFVNPPERKSEPLWLSSLPNETSEKETTQKLGRAIGAFEGWLRSNGSSSFDPYDVWGTTYGVVARRLTRNCSWAF